MADYKLPENFEDFILNEMEDDITVDYYSRHNYYFDSSVISQKAISRAGLKRNFVFEFNAMSNNIFFFRIVRKLEEI